MRTTWPWLKEVWRLADDLPLFTWGSTFDHLYPSSGEPTDPVLDGWTTLMALMATTSRLRGGVLVSGMAYRHPALLAKLAVTVDVISDGRLELGVGTGWNDAEFEAFGIPFGSMGERFDRLEEGLDVLTQLLTQDRTNFTGKYYTVTDAISNPKPLQNPLPIVIGGFGPKRTIPLVAKYAQHWNCTESDPATFAASLAALNVECERIGRDPAEIRTSALVRYRDGDDVLRRTVDALEEVGCGMSVIVLPKTEPPTIVEHLAEMFG
jgi:F420-dependent oxidoreductase-like protein